MAKAYTPGLRRFTKHERRTAQSQLPLVHPAAVEGRTRYRKRVTEPKDMPRLLKSGMHNKKIGRVVMKGSWKGMPIYTLTLEERVTCPRECHHWLDCYGNKMNWAKRVKHGQELELRLGYELPALAEMHPQGFVVRLHVLGDFYSVPYVHTWFHFLNTIPELHIYGYTARSMRGEIGREIWKMNQLFWGRCFIRFSVRHSDVEPDYEAGDLAVTIYPNTPNQKGIICPAQQDQTECCATCTLCWEAQHKIILFKAH